MKKSRFITIALFTVYLLVLIWIILLKMQFSFSTLPSIRSVNLIPLAGSAVVNGRVDTSEIIQNVLVFIPFGLYISMLKPKWPLWKRALLPIATSAAFELLQYAFAIGATDITDFLGNSLGGILGCAAYFVLSKILKGKTHSVLNGIASVGTICILIFMGMVIFGQLHFVYA